jgi:PKHD-type hydroxylase
MELENKYWWFKSVLSEEVCNKIINLGLTKIKEEEAKGNSAAGYTHGDVDRQTMPDGMSAGDKSLIQLKKEGVDISKVYLRDSKVAWLNEQWLYEIIHPYVHEANAAAGWNWEWDYSEPFQFTVYEPGGLYSWHTDGFSDHTKKYKRYIHGVTAEPLRQDGRFPSTYIVDNNMVGKIRKISVTINLSEPGSYDGGNLMFDLGQHQHSGRDQFYECLEIRDRGSMIVFPSFLPHCVTPITRGTRYSLVLWNLGKPFK